MCTITCHEQEWNVPLGQSIRNRIDPLAGEIHVQHGGIIVIMIHRIESLSKSRNRAPHNAPGGLQYFLDQYRDEIFVFDDQYSDPLKCSCHGWSSALARLPDDPKVRFSGFAGIMILQWRPPLTVSSFASPCNSKRMPRSISSVPNPADPNPSIFGPPSSCQLISRRGGRSPVMIQETATRPPGTDRAPCFAALVESS